MHDPMTVAFEIPNPFLPRYGWGKRWSNRPAFITVWHVDPDRHRVTRHDPETGERKIEGRLGRNFEGLQEAIRIWRSRGRRWYQHPRLHFWHWKIQIHPIRHFKRWAFSRCEKCGERFGWGESPISGQWHGTGPRWFRSEKNIWHSQYCHHGTVPANATPDPGERMRT
jgi:hypothetical protein